MDKLTIVPMGSHYGKNIGIFGIAAAIVLLLINNYSGFASNFEDYGVLMIGFMLAVITFSKEKFEDERVQRVRYTAFRVLIYLFCLIMLLWSMGQIQDRWNDVKPIYVLIICLSVYLITFNVFLITDSGVAFNDESVNENFKRNKKFIIRYFSIITVLVVLYFVIARTL